MKHFLTLVVAVFSLSFAAVAADEINLDKPSFFGGTWDHALGGYDTVAYFSEGKPVKGKKQFSTEYKGVQWLFSSQENLDLFLTDPDHYRPQYGGYCAWALANGYQAPGSPKAWKIVDDKLYLNYDRDVQKKWLADITGFIVQANENWPSLLAED